MLGMFINEFFGALVQVLLFSLIPLIFWLIFVRRKQNFFKWIGIKKIKHEGKWWGTACAILFATGLYIGLTSFAIRFLPEGVTTAGSDFAGKGFAAFPAVLAYGFIRTGLSEEIVFRGFLLKRFGAKFGFITGNIIQAILFGMMHGIPFGLATHNIPCDYSNDYTSRCFWVVPGMDERKKNLVGALFQAGFCMEQLMS